MRCNEDSWKTSNMCGERIYVVTRGVHTTNFFINAVIDKYHKSDKVMDDWWKKILNEWNLPKIILTFEGEFQTIF